MPNKKNIIIKYDFYKSLIYILNTYSIYYRFDLFIIIELLLKNIAN